MNGVIPFPVPASSGPPPTGRSSSGQEQGSIAGPGDAERRARIAWSFLAEPTDGAAHVVCARLGHAQALRLIGTAGPERIVALLGAEIPVDGAAPGDSRRGGAPGGSGPRLAASLARWRDRLALLDLDAELARARDHGLRVLIPGDAHWPRALDDLGDAAPHCLWVRGPGSPGAMTGPERAVAVVGSRASTPYGEDVARGLGAALSDRGICVVSGGAYGIDAASHRGALGAGTGGTIAVLAGGLDALYPRGNTELLEAIGRQGALVSEAPIGTAPTRWRFLSRNRLIAALAGTAVVVEASWRSGALSTARWADELSRPVGAVPGPVTSAASAGCHRLVRERGAVLVTEVADVVELLRHGEPAGESGFAQADELDLLTPRDRRVLDGIPPRSAIGLAELGILCAVDPDAVTAAVARLELLGLVRLRGEKVARAR
ncbi:DNA-processing protein DprA [Brachybacterium huguangmaarense]